MKTIGLRCVQLEHRDDGEGCKVENMERKKVLQTVALAILIGGVALGANALLQITRAIPGNGRVIVLNIEAYSDEACTVPLTEIAF